MVSMSDVNIIKAGVEDLPLIHDMAQVVFDMLGI